MIDGDAAVNDFRQIGNKAEERSYVSGGRVI